MDGSLLLSGSEDQTARVWHIYSRQCLRVLNHRGNMNLLIGLQSFLALRTPHYYRHVNNTYSSCTPRQKSYYTSLTKSISQCYWLSRGGGYSTKFLTGGSAPRSNLLYFYTHFCQKGYSFHISSIDKWYPLDIPSLEIHIAFKCWKINLKQERFLDFFTAIKSVRPFGLLTYQNDRFPYPFTHFSKQRQYHVMERRSVTSRYHGNKISGSQQ